MEREPVSFLLREIEGLLDGARLEIARFVGADAQDLAFVTNATAGVNTILRSLALGPGDEILFHDQGYPACRNAMEHLAERGGARIVTAHIPFPIEDPTQVVAAMLGAITPRTRLAVIDHVTSPTGLVWPVDEVVRGLADRGIDTLVDGAHALGMLPLDLNRLHAAFWVGNAHKWLCAPKGAAVLHVRRDRQAAIHPLVISHGARSERRDRSRFQLEFDWTGTGDPTAALAIPAAIRFLEGLRPGGIAALRDSNRGLVLGARRLLCETLGIEPPTPESMIGSLAAVPLPPGEAATLHGALFERHAIEVPVFAWPAPPGRLLRVSAQAYNSPEQYERLAACLPRLL